MYTKENQKKLFMQNIYWLIGYYQPKFFIASQKNDSLPPPPLYSLCILQPYQMVPLRPSKMFNDFSNGFDKKNALDVDILTLKET